jgi:uncharacterized protein (DUF342 family)
MEYDGKITLTFLNDDLEVRGDFFPPSANGTPITGEYIASLLERSGVVYGIKHDEINKALNTCVNYREIVRNVLMASGDPPVDEVPEYLQINPYLGVKNETREGDGTVDYKARSAFVIVKKGQALAKQKHSRPGKEGVSVRGETIAYKTAKKEILTGGENTKMEGRFLVSCINGQFVQARGVLSVRDSLVIKGPVGYATGNIIFPGNVEIEGPVSDGFKIYSGGSVTIKQTFDVTDTVTRNDLNVAGGIIGRGRAVVKVGGSLKTKFIENCHVAVRKNIIVDSEIISSRVFTLECLEMGEKGKIVGGETHALKGIRAGTIGKEAGRAARIHCGIDFILEQEKEKHNGILMALAIKIRRLKDLAEDPSTDEAAGEKIKAYLDKLAEEQRKAQNKVSELLGKLNAYEDASVEVKGEIEPGVLIEICHSALFVKEPLKKVKIRLDKETRQLLIEKM